MYNRATFNTQPYSKANLELVDLVDVLSQIPDTEPIPSKEATAIVRLFQKIPIQPLKKLTFGALTLFVNTLIAESAKDTYKAFSPYIPEFIKLVQDAIANISKS